MFNFYTLKKSLHQMFFLNEFQYLSKDKDYQQNLVDYNELI
jgi:hypothetical protein